MSKSISLTVLSLALGTILIPCRHSNAATPSPSAQTLANGDQTLLAENAAASPIEAIAMRAFQSHKLSAPDYSNVYNGLKARRYSASDALAGLTALIAAKNLTQPQKRQMADLCIAMLSKPYPNDPDGDLPPLVITVLGSMGDKRATPHLIPLLKAPKDTTRLAAQSALKDLGYSKTPSIQSLLY